MQYHILYNIEVLKMDDFLEGFQAEQAKIVVLGTGGAGSNTVARLTEMGISGAVAIAANTDAKHLAVTKAHKKILLGK